VRAIVAFVVVCIVVGLLCLINSIAANALFSLFVASNYVAWGTPILCRVIWSKTRFKPGEFYTGKLSRPIAIVAVLWLVFGLMLSMFPSGGPNPTGGFSSLCRPLDYANGYSDDYELHNRDQRVCVDCVHDVLFPVCTQVVHRPQDDH
jgi:amino acid transporter